MTDLYVARVRLARAKTYDWTLSKASLFAEACAETWGVRHGSCWCSAVEQNGPNMMW